MGRLAALIALLTALAFAGSAATASAAVPFFVGFAEDLPKEIGSGAVTPAAGLGGRGFRLTTLWTPGQTALAPAEAVKLDRATAAAAGQRMVLSVFADAGTKAPQDATARETYCTYVRSLLTRYPSIRDVVIWNEPNKSLFWSPQLATDGSPLAAVRYQQLLARCYDVLHGAFPTVNVIGLALSSTGNDNAGSASPGAFIRTLGDAYRASGRTAPLLDTVSFHPYGADAAERPWRKHIGSKTIAQGDWNKLLYNLHLAFNGTAQRIPGQASVRLWYLESGAQTAVDPAKAAAYTGTENVKTVPDYAGGEPDAPPPAETSAAPDQWTQALDAIRLAACQPYVTAYFNFLLADEPRLAGWQSGPYWADLTPKDSAPAFRQAIAEATAGSVACDTLKGGRPSADYMPPAAPAGLMGSAASAPLRVDLSWNAASDDTAVATYRIFRNGTHVGTTETTSWSNVSVTPGTTYSYAVRALDAAGNMGDASPAIQVTTPATPSDTIPPTAPGTPSGLPQANPYRIDLSWPAATDNVGVTSYEVRRDGVVIGSATGTSYSDQTVASARTYTYSVAARDAAGNLGPASGTAAVKSLDSSPPTMPGSLAATPANNPNRIQLSWLASTDDVGVTGYEVLRGGVLLATVTTGSYVDSAVTAGVTYTYTVRAVDAAGNRSAAASATAKVADVGDVVPPGAPPGLTGTAYIFPSRVGLTWGAATDNVGVTGYRIYRNGVQLGSTTSLAYVDYAVSRRATYGYTVRAVDAAGNLGASSATVYVTIR